MGHFLLALSNESWPLVLKNVLKIAASPKWAATEPPATLVIGRNGQVESISVPLFLICPDLSSVHVIFVYICKYVLKEGESLPELSYTFSCVY